MTVSNLVPAVVLLLLGGFQPVLAQAAPGAELYREGAAALADGEVDRAVELFAESYEVAPADLRNSIAFLWGLSVFRQGESILRENTDGDFQRHREGIERLEQAIVILRRSSDPRSDMLIESIREYIASARGPTIAATIGSM